MMTKNEQKLHTLGEALARYPHGVRNFSCLSPKEKERFAREGKTLQTADGQLNFLQQMLDG